MSSLMRYDVMSKKTKTAKAVKTPTMVETLTMVETPTMVENPIMVKTPTISYGAIMAMNILTAIGHINETIGTRGKNNTFTTQMAKHPIAMMFVLARKWGYITREHHSHAASMGILNPLSGKLVLTPYSNSIDGKIKGVTLFLNCLGTNSVQAKASAIELHLPELMAGAAIEYNDRTVFNISHTGAIEMRVNAHAMRVEQWQALLDTLTHKATSKAPNMLG